MKQISTQAIVYKIMHYSDRSAVALAFSPEFGKLKLFIPKAYSSKGGFMTFVPGNITFSQKETSDLHRFISFSHNPDYYHYTQTPEIMIRMNLAFDFFDHLFHSGENCRALWQLCLKYDDENYRKVGLYTIYRLLREAGIMFDPVCECSNPDSPFFLYDGQMYCAGCLRAPETKTVKLSDAAAGKLRSFSSNDLFKQTYFSGDQEKELLNLFSDHLDHIMGKEGLLKSLKVFMSIA